MKFNLTIVLTLILLGSVLGASSASAWFAFTLGYKALKGVTQPDLAPAQFLDQGKQTAEQRKGPAIVPEREILVKVYDYIHSKGGSVGGIEKDPGRERQYQNESNQQQNQQFPFQTIDRSVKMEVTNTSNETDSLLLNVNLKNEGTAPVNFLYSFLDIMDDRGRAISGITDGLPGQLPANGKKYSGTVKIPKTLLYESKKIDLILTDYPEQKLRLKIEEIPVNIPQAETELR